MTMEEYIALRKSAPELRLPELSSLDSWDIAIVLSCTVEQLQIARARFILTGEQVNRRTHSLYYVVPGQFGITP